MQTQRPTTRKDRKAKLPATVPSRFVPRFWEDADKRQAHVRLIREHIKRLQQECGATSIAKRMLVERAVFIHLQCQTIELNSYEGQHVELSHISAHAQLSNALSGLLSKLGLDKSDLEDVQLSTILAESRKR